MPQTRQPQRQYHQRRHSPERQRRPPAAQQVGQRHRRRSGDRRPRGDAAGVHAGGRRHTLAEIAFGDDRHQHVADCDGRTDADRAQPYAGLSADRAHDIAHGQQSQRHGDRRIRADPCGDEPHQRADRGERPQRHRRQDALHALTPIEIRADSCQQRPHRRDRRTQVQRDQKHQRRPQPGHRHLAPYAPHPPHAAPFSFSHHPRQLHPDSPLQEVIILTMPHADDRVH